MNKILSPNIYRQRLLIEANYTLNTTEKEVNEFLISVCNELGVTRATEKPFVNCTYGTGKPENQGFEAFQPLIESGISIYTWDNDKFLSILFFTCKPFDANTAINFSNSFFGFTDYTFKEF